MANEIGKGVNGTLSERCYSLSRKKTNTNMTNCEHLSNVDVGHMGVSWVFFTLVCVLGGFFLLFN